MSKANNLADFLKDIADAIRNKKGTSGVIQAQNMSDEIASIQTGITPTGNIELQQQTGTNVTNYATASVKSGRIIFDDTELNVPITITINTSTGLITASHSGNTSKSATKQAGWIDAGSASFNIVSSGSKTYQLSKQAGTTITPGTSTKVAVSSGKYTTGTVYVAGSSYLVPTNIKKNVTIFGVTGSYEGSATRYIKFYLGFAQNGYPYDYWGSNGWYCVPEGTTWRQFLANYGPITMNFGSYRSDNFLRINNTTGKIYFQQSGCFVADDDSWNWVNADDEIYDNWKYYQDFNGEV